MAQLNLGEKSLTLIASIVDQDVNFSKLVYCLFDYLPAQINKASLVCLAFVFKAPTNLTDTALMRASTLTCIAIDLGCAARNKHEAHCGSLSLYLLALVLTSEISRQQQPLLSSLSDRLESNFSILVLI